MRAPEDQHLAALRLYRRAFAAVQEQSNISTEVSTMIAEADAITKKANFDFFGLPAEIRDMIYEECLGTRQNDYNEDIRLQYAAKNVATLNFICPQFQTEYKARAQAHQYLFLFDPGNHPDQEVIAFQQGFFTWRRITIILQLEDGRATASLDSYIDWLELLVLQLQRAEQMKICFRFPAEYKVAERMWDIVQRASKTLLSFEYVQLYLSRLRDDEVETREKWTCGEPMALFSRERGCFVKAGEEGMVWDIE